MIDLVDIRGAIVSGHMTNADLDSIQQAVTFARSQLAKQKIRTFNKGAMVKFTSNRNGQFYVGTVEKVGIKNITVRTPVGLYRVPANMLESV
jgi:inorganic pyrophosphatase/exopolyphosphatase